MVPDIPCRVYQVTCSDQSAHLLTTVYFWFTPANPLLGNAPIFRRPIIGLDFDFENRGWIRRL